MRLSIAKVRFFHGNMVANFLIYDLKVCNSCFLFYGYYNNKQKSIIYLFDFQSFMIFKY